MDIITTLPGSVVTFIVSLLVGGLGIYVGAAVVSTNRGFKTAVLTALLGSLAWAGATLLVGWFPILGGVAGLVLGLLLYLAVITIQYNVGFVDAAAIAFIAWIAVVVVRAVLGPVGAVGIPFV